VNHEPCLILKNRKIAPDIFELAIHAPRIASSCTAGQFVMVYLDKREILLPRPISVCRCEREDIYLVYKVMGDGTKHISTLTPGTFLRITGPLGKGFTIKRRLKKVALIGGGIGVPPMVMLYKTLKDVQADIYLGFKEESILTEHFEGAAGLYIATETGQEGMQGNVLDLLNYKSQHYDEMYACGPKPMLAAISQYVKNKAIPLQISLEERMACGIGTCMGCVISGTHGRAASEVNGQPPDYMKICCEGPVFYSDKVVLDA